MNKNLEQCTGCASCYNKCPVNAITMEENKEGFLYPIIDEKKCINCGLCTQVCPIKNVNFKNKKQKYVYAIAASDEIRKNSSSGGIFSIIANNILENNGYVCGAAFSEDFTKVQHIIIDKKEDLYKLQTSKYLQSEINECYKKIEKLLKENHLVLFSGTPCQVEGLNKYLNKEYSNLLTIDILCHGVPSPKIWQEYLKHNFENKKIQYVNFRCKDNGWALSSNLKIEFSNNTIFKEHSDINKYYRAFLSNLILRKSCYKCEYTTTQRVSDITLGDFWGINKFDKKINDNKGLSICLLNTHKANIIFQKIKSEFKIYKKFPIKCAKKGNPILKQASKKHINRDTFMNKMDIKLMDKYLDKTPKYDGIITNFWFTNNYGAALTAYALQQLFKDKGFDYKILNYNPNKEKEEYKNCIITKFVDKYLSKTHKIKTKHELEELNKYTDNFVVGSDQVFRYKYTKNSLETYFYTYTDFSKRRVAFSASFGTNKFEADIENTYKIEKFLKRFHSITTRELDGINLCKNTFNINNVTQLLDPVFLTDKKHFLELINSQKENFYKNKIACYILDQSEEINAILNKISKETGLEIFNINKENVSVEEFLTAIKHSKFLITDSFHGTCFAILFHTPFKCYRNLNRGNSRFQTLIDIFNIKEFFTDNYSKINIQINNKINWEIFDNIIKNEKNKMDIWFNKTFLEPIKFSNEQFSNEFDFIKIINKKEKFKLKDFIFNKIKTETHREITILGIKLNFRRKH